MSEFNISIEGGTSYRLHTAGKFCDRDIVVTAEGSVPLVDYWNAAATYVPSNIFVGFNELRSIRFDKATNVEEYAFERCKNLESIYFPLVTTLESNAFVMCDKLTSVYIPKAETIGENAFLSCDGLQNLSLPSATTLYGGALALCSALETVNLPSVKSVGELAFKNCTMLKTVDMGAVESVGAQAFLRCTALKAVIVRNEASVCVCDLTAFDDTPIITGTGFVYIPSSMWDYYAAGYGNYIAIFRKLEDYTVDGTITGDLDESKI